MNPTIDRLKIFFLIVFAIGAAAIWGYQIFYVWPAQRCDERAGWWDFKGRVCAQPIYIPSITGRPAGMSRKEWSEQQAARQSQRDREGYPTGDAAPAAEPKAADAASAVTPPAKK